MGVQTKQVLCHVLRGLLAALGGVLGLAVLLVAIVYGMHRESSLFPGHGIDLPESFAGYTMLITGSSSGIGFEGAILAYKKGAHVIVHGSSQKRAEQSVESIKREVGADAKGSLTALGCDLSNFEEVRHIATIILQHFPKIHALFLNAALLYSLGPAYDGYLAEVMKKPPESFWAATGHDRLYAANHMGQYLLFELIKPVLAPGCKIVIVTSFSSWQGSPARLFPPWGKLGTHTWKEHPATYDRKRIYWEWPGLKEHCHNAYYDSKLANVCLGRWITRKHGHNFTVINHEPGYVSAAGPSDRNSFEYKQRLYRFSEDLRYYQWHAPTVEGGKHLIHSAFVNMKPVPDYVLSYFCPKWFAQWFTDASWDVEGNRTWLGYSKVSWLVDLMNYQRFSWGLHYTVGPFCDNELQDKLMLWTQQELGLDRDGTSLLPLLSQPPPAPPQAGEPPKPPPNEPPRPMSFGDPLRGR